MTSSQSKIIKNADVEGVVFCTPAEETEKKDREFWRNEGFREGENKAFKELEGVLTLLQKETVVKRFPIAEVNEDLCYHCGLCVTSCPYGAMEAIEVSNPGMKVVVNKETCLGCGQCVSTCPVIAFSLSLARSRSLDFLSLSISARYLSDLSLSCSTLKSYSLS